MSESRGWSSIHLRLLRVTGMVVRMLRCMGCFNFAKFCTCLSDHPGDRLAELELLAMWSAGLDGSVKADFESMPPVRRQGRLMIVRYDTPHPRYS